jgi:hypothetical protein
MCGEPFFTASPSLGYFVISNFLSPIRSEQKFLLSISFISIVIFISTPTASLQFTSIFLEFITGLTTSASLTTFPEFGTSGFDHKP